MGTPLASLAGLEGGGGYRAPTIQVAVPYPLEDVDVSGVTSPTMATSPTTVPADLAASGLLIYDGACGFCTASARWYEARSGDGGAIAPWQSLDLDRYSLTEAEVGTAVYWSQDGQVWRGADAIGQALKACSGRWRFAGHILANPPVLWLARLIYPIVARFRYRLPGATDACHIN